MLTQAWRPLTDLNPSRREPQVYEFQFPDGTLHRPTKWKYLMRDVVKWLCDNDHIFECHCPIQWPNARYRYLVHSVPYHSNGEHFSDYEEAGPACIETKDTNGRLVANTKFIIEERAPHLLNSFRFRKQRGI